ncbi:hypothetical protein A3A84_03355 [Candidatus Collierbacteria bacterium RIFCSPLOWO2_01_FULL_50_23]|nr:MAG: hypothetical protein A3A84_03355 [Candidatus Collierbacteria bacterium RIFCSPLOWO2_01_FULL_50_23]
MLIANFPLKVVVDPAALGRGSNFMPLPKTKTATIITTNKKITFDKRIMLERFRETLISPHYSTQPDFLSMPRYRRLLNNTATLSFRLDSNTIHV